MRRVLIVDYGSQYTQLIKMRLREEGHEAIVIKPEDLLFSIQDTCGIILSGGPRSVYEKGAPGLDDLIARLIFVDEIPTLAICYGMQLIAEYAGKGYWTCVEPGEAGEYGKATIELSHRFGVLEGLGRRETAWMSHGDSVVRLPPNFQRFDPVGECVITHCKGHPIAAMAHLTKPIFGLQFHPEVSHTRSGKKIIRNFLEMCGADKNWNEDAELERMKWITSLEIGSRHVFAFISGGNDSSALAKFLQKIVPKERLHLFYVRGLGPNEDLEKIKLIGGVEVIDARRKTYAALRGIIDPEDKRKIIGEIFARIFKEEAKKLRQELGLSPKGLVLAQGTIHPDIIESGGSRHADRIKSHHNTVVQELLGAGGAIEPFSQLFKPNVRRIGRILGVDERLITQHPSPGPGHAVRFLCANGSLPHDYLNVSYSMEQREAGLRKVCEKLGYKGWMLPLKSKGVGGDQATYCYAAGLIGPYEREPLLELASAIPNRFKGKINRVVWHIAPHRVKSLGLVALKADYFRAETRDMVELANRILIKNLRLANLYPLVSQAFVVIAPMSSNRQGYSAIIRAVETQDYMTAEPLWLPEPFLKQVADEILRSMPKIHSVFYDLASKPPGTIEWE